MRVGVLGPGGVGGLLAGALQRSGTEVTVVARDSTAAVISQRGLRVDSVSLGGFVAHPRAAERLEEPVDVLIVATKASGLKPALERIDTAPDLVLPLLNGLDHIAILRERFEPGSVLAGSIRVEADRPESGVVVHTSPFLVVEMASRYPAVRPAIRSTPELRADLVTAIEEGCAVGLAEGALDVDPARAIGELERAHETLGSSMQRDIAAGRTPELDAIPGAVLRAAARHGLECPTIERLVAIIAARAGIASPLLAR